eukprot:1634543-Rhodomonas_salina.1
MQIDGPYQDPSKPVWLNELFVAPSKLPGGGLGVFTRNKVKKGAALTVYGGELIGRDEAKARRAGNKDTHQAH